MTGQLHVSISENKIQQFTPAAGGTLRTISATLNFCAGVDIFVVLRSSLRGQWNVSIQGKFGGTYGFTIEVELREIAVTMEDGDELKKRGFEQRGAW